MMDALSWLFVGVPTGWAFSFVLVVRRDLPQPVVRNMCLGAAAAAAGAWLTSTSDALVGGTCAVLFLALCDFMRRRVSTR